MKKIFLLTIGISFLVACADKKEPVKDEVVEEVSYTVFGDSISAENVLSKEEMVAKYETLKPGDTLNLKFGSEINATCAKKGCWMTLDLGNEKDAFVKFRGYEFFVPKEGAEQHYAIVEGKAFVTEVSVDELKHYAKDKGKSQQAIDSIIEPKRTLSFMADGVLIADKK